MSAVKQVTTINENEVTSREGTQAGSVPAPAEVEGSKSELVRALRRRLPDERRAVTHHFSVGGQEGYLTVGVYDDGLPGEIFLTMQHLRGAYGAQREGYRCMTCGSECS